jgi:Tfp pilus assembly protein PilE
MSEVIATIAIMGVLAGICIAGMTGVLKGSKSALAEAKLEMLNKGLECLCLLEFGADLRSFQVPRVMNSPCCASSSTETPMKVERLLARPM